MYLLSLPIEILLVVGLLGVVVVLLCLECLSELVQESTHWEQVRSRVRRRRKSLQIDPALRDSGEFIDAEVIEV